MYILALDSWYLEDIHATSSSSARPLLVTHNGLGTPRTVGLRAGSGSTAPRSGCSEPPPSPSRRTPAQAHTENSRRCPLLTHVIECQPRHEVQRRLQGLRPDADLVQERLAACRGRALLDPRRRGRHDPEAGQALGRGVRGAGRGHDAVDQRHVLLSVGNLATWTVRSESQGVD